MKIIGSFFSRVDDESQDALSFNRRYKRSWSEAIIDYELFHITQLDERNTPIIVALEYDGTINQIMVAEPGEAFRVYSDGCMSDEGHVFNTDGDAFIRAYRKTSGEWERLGVYCVENSPWDMKSQDEWDEINCSLNEGDDQVTPESLVKDVNKLLMAHKCAIQATTSNTIFIRQL